MICSTPRSSATKVISSLLASEGLSVGAGVCKRLESRAKDKPGFKSQLFKELALRSGSLEPQFPHL